MTETILQAIEVLFDTLLFFPGPAHPWDYVGHFIVNFVGVIVIYSFLTLLRIRQRISLSLSILILGLISIAKEIDDRGHPDILGDMTANILGIGFALACVIIFDHLPRLRIFRHP